MKYVLWVALLLYGAPLWAAKPVPVHKSAAEKKLSVDLVQAGSDDAKVKICRRALKLNPADVPLGIIAQDVLMKQMTDPVAFFKARSDSSSLIAPHYLYGRVCGDSAIAAQECQWIHIKDSTSVWGFLLAADNEWERSKPDLGLVRSLLDSAQKLDPSRPEVYLNLGWLYMDDAKWPEARLALESGFIADPSNMMIRDARLTVYADMRDENAYFMLARGIFSDKPLKAKLPFANHDGFFTDSLLQGKPTVLEIWAFT